MIFVIIFRNGIMTKTIKNIALIASIVFLFEFIYAPLLHNHAADIYDHYNCPAYLISVTFVSFAIALFFAFDFKIPFHKKLENENSLQKPQLEKIKNFSLRAPPF
jgi:hypothetical protein